MRNILYTILMWIYTIWPRRIRRGVWTQGLQKYCRVRCRSDQRGRRGNEFHLFSSAADHVQVNCVIGEFKTFMII